MKKKLIIVLVTFAHISVFGQVTVTGLTSGNGSSSNPYILSSAVDLQTIYSYSSSHTGETYANTYFQLANHIDMTGVSTMPYIANEFAGSFDGKKYSIKNLTSPTVEHIVQGCLKR